jgi:hypothetical protein
MFGKSEEQKRKDEEMKRIEREQEATQEKEDVAWKGKCNFYMSGSYCIHTGAPGEDYDICAKEKCILQRILNK